MSDLWLARLARTSTDEQKKEKTVDVQIMQSPHEIKRRHLLIEDGGQWQLFIRNPLAHRDDRSNFFCDEGYNLESLDGDYEIVEMLELIRAGLINGIYMDNSNRLLRSTKAEIRGRIMDIITEHDVQIFDSGGEITTGVLMEIVAAMNASDKKSIGRRLMLGKIRKAKESGAPTGGIARFGYRYDKHTESWSIVQEESKWLQWAAWTSLGIDRPDLPENLRALITANPKGVSDDLIIKEMNAMGFSMIPFYERSNLNFQKSRNPTGKMNRNWLNSRFRDDQYCGVGEYYFKDVNLVGKKRKITKEEKERIEISRPAIFDLETFGKLKARRKQRALMYSKNGKHDYLVERMARCGCCDAVMSARPGWSPLKKNGKRYLREISKMLLTRSIDLQL